MRLSPPVHSFYSQIGRLELEWSDTGPKSLVKTPSGEVRIVTGEASIHALSTALGLDVAPDYWLGMLGGDVDAAAPRGERFIPFDYAPCDDQSATGLILRDGVLTNEMACWIPKHGPVWGAMTVTLDEYVEDLLSSWGVLSWASSATRGRDVLTNEPELAKRFRALARPRRA